MRKIIKAFAQAVKNGISSLIVATERKLKEANARAEAEQAALNEQYQANIVLQNYDLFLEIAMISVNNTAEISGLYPVRTPIQMTAPQPAYKYQDRWGCVFKAMWKGYDSDAASITAILQEEVDTQTFIRGLPPIQVVAWLPGRKRCGIWMAWK